MSLTFEEVLKSAFAKTIKDVLDEREQRIKTDGDKQDALESGVNIKTVNGQSILGAGNLEVAGAANVYMVQEGDITFVSQESTQDFVVQLSPSLLSAVTEFKARIDFPNMKEYNLPNIDVSYAAATPVTQADDFTSGESSGVGYTYLSNGGLAFFGVYFIHYTLRGGAPIDEWHLSYAVLDFLDREDLLLSLRSMLQFYGNYKSKLDYIYYDGIAYEIGGDYVTNVVVSSEDWTADSTYTDFPYKAAISIMMKNGVSNIVFEVIFDVPEAISGNYSPVCYYDELHGGVLYIWAKEIPDHDITIPLIKQIL